MCRRSNMTEKRDEFGTPFALCDWCDRPIGPDDGMAVDGNCHYHLDCWEEINKQYPLKLEET